MLSSKLSYTFRVAAAALWMTTVYSVASAQGTGCLGNANLADGEINTFISNPKAMLDLKDELDLMTMVRSLVGSSELTVTPVIEISIEATPQQMAAIGAGMARAANSCLKRNPQYKLSIEKIVAERATKDSRLMPLLVAFARALGDGVTASLGAGQRGGGNPQAPSISNGGTIGMTVLGSDNGLGFEGTQTAGVLRISRYSVGRSLSPTQPSSP